MAAKSKYYSIGFDTGYDIANTNIGDYQPSEHDDFISEMAEHESDVYRQYSPFEFLAKHMNEWESRWNRDGELWDKYESGVYDGIVKAIKDFTYSD